VRRALFQVHLWIGVTAGLYLVLISVTGSIAVFRREVIRHAEYLPAMEWVVDLHDNLLSGRTGRVVNGIGGVALTVLTLTGIVVWWRGTRKWFHGFIVKRRTRWPRFTFDLHSAAGIWLVAFLLLWGVTGIYFAFPQPFATTIDFFEPESFDQPVFRRGDWVLEWMVRLHFGRFGGWTSRVIWAVLGLVPVLLFVTGAMMWWNRVVRARRSWRALSTSVAKGGTTSAPGSAAVEMMEDSA
jgi:uncharacterized iron-regulated membrane protein